MELFLKSSWFCKFFGNGFAAGEKLVAAQSNAVMYTLDSEWFAILISNGLLGAFLYLMFWLSTIKQIFTAYRIDRSNVILAETVGVLLIILCEPSLSRLWRCIRIMFSSAFCNLRTLPYTRTVLNLEELIMKNSG